MHKSLYKDIIREIRKSFGRFFSIFAISALGVAFFAGVISSADAMKYNADAYFDATNLYDIRLVSTMGFTQEDIESIKKIKGVKGLLETTSLDVLTEVDASELVLKVLTLPEDIHSSSYINQAVLTKGRMPKNNTECLLEDGSLHQYNFHIGDTVSLYSGTKENLKDTLKETSCTIVGMAHNPLYLSFEHGSSSIGNGSIDAFLMMPSDNFKTAYSTDVYVTVQDAEKENSYTTSYFDKIKPVQKRFTTLGEKRIEVRLNEIKEKANEELATKEKEYEQNQEEFTAKIKQGEAEIEAGKEKLLQSKMQLEAEKNRREIQFMYAENQIKDGKKEIEASKLEFQNKKNQLDQMQKQVQEILPTLEKEMAESKAKIEEYQKSIAEIDKKLEDTSLSEEDRLFYEKQKQYLQDMVHSSELYLPVLEEQLSKVKKQLTDAQTELEVAQKKIEAAEILISQKEQELQKGKNLYQKEIQKGEASLREGQKKIEESSLQLASAKADGEKELALGKEKLEKAKQQIKQKQSQKWYVLDRSTLYSYKDYEGAADRMRAIAKVFPVFFFLVAALVCLTTMTRMVEEQRGLIGTYKALGYSRFAIASKYLIYASCASIFGGIIGAILGMLIFPNVIYSVWNIMYTLPTYQTVFYPGLGLLAILLVTTITTLAAFFSVYREMVEVPAMLMRPKSPTVGKKIVLEKISLIWSHLSFLKKVTARNLFRYKKRFFMTVIGISGCTALLVAGFGIRDSIRKIVPLQFGEIFQYDMTVSYEKENTYSQNQALFREIEKTENVQESMQIYSSAATASQVGKKEAQDVSVVIPTDIDKFQKFVSLHTRRGKQKLSLSEDGIVITEKLAKALSLKKGDMLSLTIDGEAETFKIEGITENYIGHYIYMNETVYKEAYETTPQPTSAIAKMKKKGEQAEKQMGEVLMQKEGITSVSFYTSLAKNFENMVSSLTLVTIVLLIAAGLLAFTVLYNLTNVNISERIREIATIKVLGFYNREVSAYVYRENIALTIIGAFVGLILGIFLHLFIMNVAELDTVMFGRNIDGLSFVLSFVITILFALIVNLAMKKKLSHISMVESLKSVE